MKDLFVDVDGVMTKVNLKEVTFMPTFKGAEKFIFDNGEIIDITFDEATRLAKLVMEHFDWCECYPESDLDECREIVYEWFANNKENIKAMVKHPNWNGDYAIEFDTPLRRTIDKTVYHDFMCSLYNYAKKMRVPLTFEGLQYSTICTMYEEFENHIYHAECIADGFPAVQEYIDEQKVKLAKMKTLKDMVNAMWSRMEVHKANGEVYDENEFLRIEKIRDIFDTLNNRVTQFISADTEIYINSRFPEFRAKEGQKTSRVVNKLCKMLGLDKITWGWLMDNGFDVMDNADREANAYNYKFAQFADAINPFEINKHVFLSAHIVEAYLAMSWGTNWSTCMTTDKNNKHGWGSGTGASYHGMYSGGVMSYMLDGSTLTFYILGKDAIKEAEEKGEPSPRKEMRQLFHIGKEKFIQGRLYPYDQTDKGNSAEPSDYIQYREIVQNILSEIWGVPNLWTNKRGNSANEPWVETKGCHYTDYLHYPNTNISFLKDFTNNDLIKIGAKGRCPACGEHHRTDDNCFCSNCQRGGRGRTWCEYHEEWEDYNEDEMTYVEGFGDVCDDALYYSGDFTRCDSCDEWVYTGNCDDNGVYSNRDERFFCCEDCAERAGYFYSSHYEDWLNEDDTYYSEIDDMDLLDDDDDTCWAYYNEHDTTIALKESCYFINGEWYDADKCVETVNGNYIPEWEAVEADGDWYEKADCFELDGEWYPSSLYAEVDGVAVRTEDVA